MKYRDVILAFVSICFFLSLGYSLGVDQRFWFLPAILLVALIILIYTLWIMK